MKLKLIPLLLLGGSLTAFAATEEQLNESFTVPAGGTVIVDVDFGSITVNTDAAAGVTVDVWRKITRATKAEEEKFLRDNPVHCSRDGAKVIIRSRSKSRNARVSNERNQNEAKYTIHVPAKFNAQLNTSGGPISVSDLAGDVKADTSGGGLEFARLRGALDGNTSGGGIEVADCRGALKTFTSGGGIRVNGGSGSLLAETSGGGIQVREFGGPANFKCSGGGIVVENVLGKVEGSTSGGGVSAVLPSPLPGEVALSTSGGEVAVRIPAGAAFELDARSSGGSVSSELPVAFVGKSDSSRLRGAVNGGGPSVRLRTSGGGIRVDKL